MSTASKNPFATEEAWEVSTGNFLKAGNYVCEIQSQDGGGTSSGGHPQLEIQVGCDDGEIRDWIVITPATIGKITQLTDAAGIRRPNDNEVVLDGSGYRLSPDYLALLERKRVGVIVREEKDLKDPTRTRDRVKGYVTPDKITKAGASDVTPAASFGAADGFQIPKGRDDDIPF